MIKANKGLVAIFDIDETLIQSGLKLKKDVAEALGRLGVNILPEQVIGDWYALASSYGIRKDDFYRELDKRKSWEQALRDGDVMIFEDVYPCLDALAEGGVTLGVLTRSIPEYTNQKINYFGLRRYFEDRIAITSVDKKIAPTKNVEAVHLMSQFHSFLDKAYFIGDSSEDVLVADFILEEMDIFTKGVYLNRYREPVPEEIKSYRTISSLEEVPEIILGGNHGK